VLRPYEITNQNLQDSGILDAYDVAGYWNQRPVIDALDSLAGRYRLEFDAEFAVYHRHTGSTRIRGGSNLPAPPCARFRSGHQVVGPGL
jgi:hypothetical protein